MQFEDKDNDNGNDNVASLVAGIGDAQEPSENFTIQLVHVLYNYLCLGHLLADDSFLQTLAPLTFPFKANNKVHT